MPIYEYRCGDCEQIFEEWQTGFEERELTCPVCGGKARRLISNTSFVLKGTGWYTTDYCRSSSNGGNGGNGNGSKSGAKAATSADTASTASGGGDSGGGKDSASSGTAASSSGS